MKKIVIRILVTLTMTILTYMFFMFIVKHFTKIEYKYLTYDNEWGVSEKCYVRNGDLYCKINGINTRVMQYYWED